MKPCLSRRLVLAAAAAASLAPQSAFAQDYPNRPVKVVVPYSAGGASDAPMRVIAQELARQLGQGVVVENKPGQGAMIGAEQVVRAAPDGYTLLLTSNPHAISANLYDKLSFDPMEDFTPISLFSREPSVLVVHPSLPVNNLKEFIDYVKARPGQVNYATSGNGSAQHLFTAMFLSAAGLKMVHVPYKGSAPAVQDVVAGQVPVAMPGLAAMMPHIRDKRLRPLATTGATRSPLLPDVPTMAESGFPNFTAYVWSGLAAPKGTPQPVIDRLNRELRTAMATPAVKAFMEKAAIEAVTSTPAELQAFMRQEKERAGRIIKEVGVKVD
ncbi:MAG TPA: tripartite tricarboxylate transporter substrate binding protein [Ramlibacter sp.]|jgi:tripartite-type tricarboxylate transporter receptor subunit TctC|nr:tripartite tricarboxylate transporter substrate binding protein [Ramlibacter sp.]